MSRVNLSPVTSDLDLIEILKTFRGMNTFSTTPIRIQENTHAIVESILLLGKLGMQEHQNSVLKEDEKNKKRKTLEKFAYNSVFEIGKQTENHLPSVLKNEFNQTAQKTIFEFLGKSTDENLYSDHIAALLDPRKSGDFAYALLYSLLPNKFLKNQFGELSLDTFRREIGYLNPKREYPLHKLNDGPESALMRMDIFVETSKFYLIFENKTKSVEHDSQTIHYFNAVKAYATKPVLGIYLTPDGMSAEDPRYRCMSYVELLEIFLGASRLIQSKEQETHFLSSFLTEVDTAYVRAVRKNIQIAREYRRKNG